MKALTQRRVHRRVVTCAKMGKRKEKPVEAVDEQDRAGVAGRKGPKKAVRGGKGGGGGGGGVGGGVGGGSFGDVLKKALQRPSPGGKAGPSVGSGAKGNVELKKRLKEEKTAREEKKILVEKRKWFQKEHIIPVKLSYVLSETPHSLLCTHCLQAFCPINYGVFAGAKQCVCL